MKLPNSVKKTLSAVFCMMAVIFLAGAGHSAFAQNGTLKVHGTVSCNGEAVIGASVIVNGTTDGTVTDIDGRYALSVSPDAVLTVSAIGYSTEVVEVAGRTLIDVTLFEEALNLDDAVVVGYGVQKKVNLTGAVSSVSTEELKGKPIANVLEGLQGTTPGLVIQQGSSTPGGSPSINIRGYNTMNNNDPLVLIDGIEGSLANVNPADIEQISVLKDASSTAIYGSRASNGVLLVTTKHGKEGQVEVNYNMTYGLQQATALPSVVDSWVYAELYNEAAVNSGRPAKFTADQIAGYKNGGTNVKWIREIYKNYAPQQTHNVSVSGGNDRLSYMGSIGYLGQESLFQGPDFGYDRFNARLNVSHKMTDYLTIKLTSSYTRNNIRSCPPTPSPPASYALCLRTLGSRHKA